MSLIKQPILIIKCPICKKNDWRSYGGTQYLCNGCEYKLDIKRKDDWVQPEI